MAKSFNAPMLVVMCADPDHSGHKDGKDYYLVDTAIAFEHLVLAAAAEGLGTCWLGGMFNEAEVKRQLGIPEKLRVVAITPLGYPEDGTDKNAYGGRHQKSRRSRFEKSLKRDHRL